MRYLFSFWTLMFACNTTTVMPVGKYVPIQNQDVNVLKAMYEVSPTDFLVGGKISIQGNNLKLATNRRDYDQTPVIVSVNDNSAFMQAAKELDCSKNECNMLIVPRPKSDSLYIVMNITDSACISWDILAKKELIVRRESCGS